MQTKVIAIILAFAATSFATPVSLAESNTVESWSEPATGSEGTITYYKRAVREENTLDARGWFSSPKCSAGGDAPKCDRKHGARNDACQSLLTDLYANSGIVLANSPRQICYDGPASKDQYCCVSWHNVVNGLTKGALSGTVNTLLSTCTQNGVSGLVNNINFRDSKTGKDVCTKVCLSNRGTHC